MALSDKHQDFINEYFLCNMNGTDAYQRVYPGASYNTARANASRLLASANIKAEIQRRLEEKKMSADEVLARLSDIGRSDIADFVEVEGSTDLLSEEYRGKTHVIKKFKKNVTITRTKDGGEIEHQYTELELHDPLSALDKVGRHYKLFVDRTEVTGKDGEPLFNWLEDLRNNG